MASLPIIADDIIPGYGAVDSSSRLGRSNDAHSMGNTSRHRPRRRRPRTASTTEMLDNLERFSRRTISTSLHSADIQSEVNSALLEEGEPSDDEDDEPRTPSTQIVGESTSATDISNFETIIHLLKGNIGMGVLTLPIAIRNSGLIFGSLGLIFIAYVCVHCMRMLVEATHRACSKRPEVKFLDYADTAEAAFLDAGGFWPRYSGAIRKVVNIFLILTQVGSNAVYVLFIAQNLQPIFVNYGGEFFQKLNYRYYIAFVLPFMVAICSIRNLRYLSPFSVLANILQFIGIGIIFYYIFCDPLPNSHTVPWLADASRLPLFFGTAIFAIEGISVVLPIENQMRYPKDMLGFNGVLNTSMTLVGCLYVGMGFFGYLKYGENIQSSITLNLPSADILAQLTLFLFSLAIFFSYALQFYVLMEILGPNLIQPRVPARWYSSSEYATRVGMNVLTFALAATIPWLDLLVSLLGAVKMSTLSLMAPALIDTATNWDNLGRCKWRLAKNGLVFLFGFFGMIMGTYVSLLNIVENFRKE